MTDVISKATTAAVAGDQWTVHHHDRTDSTREAMVAKLGLGSTESAAPSASSVPPIFSLSNELLIKIITNLYYPNDIYTCQQTCRKLNNLIINSELIQYILRTALSGVFDPLVPGLSLPERLEALERWETAWAEMDLREPNTRIETLIPTGPDYPSEFSFGGQYFIVFREGYAQPAGYSFLDVRSIFSSHADTALWKTIQVDIPNVLVFAFAPRLDLIVAISAPDAPGNQKSTLKIYPLRYSTGAPHPLASRPTFELTVPGASAYNLSNAEVLGDYILYCVGDPTVSSPNDALCTIYLIAWREGWVTILRTANPGMYSSIVSMLSNEVVLLIRLEEPGLELCRLTNISRPDASLETMCILSLPKLTMGASLHWATCYSEHPGPGIFSKCHCVSASDSVGAPVFPSTYMSARRPPPPEGWDPRRQMPYVSADGITIVVMHVEGLSGYSRTIDLSVQRRSLLAFTSNRPVRTGARAEAQTGEGDGAVPTVPWEEWGLKNTRVLELNSFPQGALAGERRAMVLQVPLTRIVMRDYNPFRVRRALSRTGGSGNEIKLECGSVMKVVAEKSVCGKSEWFVGGIESSLPYVETVTPYPGCERIIMDVNYLLAEVRTETGERKFHLHTL